MAWLIIFCAQYLYLIIILIGVASLIFLNNVTRLSALKLTLVALPVSYLIAKLTDLFFYNPRPFVVDHVKPLFVHATDNGFPSDHTLLTTTIALIVFTYNRKIGVFLGILSLIVGFSRVLANVHHPVDILGGIVIAFISVMFSWYLIKKLNNLKQKVSTNHF